MALTHQSYDAGPSVEPLYERRAHMGVGSGLADKISDVLFDDHPLLTRVAFERNLVERVKDLLENFQAKMLMDDFDEERARQSLGRLDAWLDGRLSGRSIKTLIYTAEIHFPSVIEYMPRVLARRYEEIRVARIWSSLLSPAVLERLARAIAHEREFEDLEQEG